jgi:flagellar motor switch/type III secretory pathway protein FliN
VNVYPFLLFKRSSADLLIEQAGTALARWSACWTTLPDHMVSCAAASDRPRAPTPALNANWRHRTLANGASVWIAVPNGLERYLEQLLFNLNEMDGSSEKHLSSEIGIAVADEALEDLLAALIRATCRQESETAAPAPIPDRLFRHGYGAALCTISLGDKSIKLLLPAEAFATPVKTLKQPSRAPTATLHQALADIQVRLSVEVCQAELTIGYLQTLAVGDVLALPVSVDHAMRVIGPGDSTVCHAHLGSKAGFHAVELIKSAV